MPTHDLSRPDAVEAPSAPVMQPTTAVTKVTLHDLYTGGWKRPLTGLPSAVGRPLARWIAARRSLVATWHPRASHGGAHH
jgi:hypothetical protein